MREIPVPRSLQSGSSPRKTVEGKEMGKKMELS